MTSDAKGTKGTGGARRLVGAVAFVLALGGCASYSGYSLKAGVATEPEVVSQFVAAHAVLPIAVRDPATGGADVPDAGEAGVRQVFRRVRIGSGKSRIDKWNRRSRIAQHRIDQNTPAAYLQVI